jgi:hypothetical protein
VGQLMSKWLINMAKYLLLISMIPKLFLFSQVTFATGDKDFNLPTTTKITVKFGKVYKNWMVKL